MHNKFIRQFSGVMLAAALLGSIPQPVSSDPPGTPSTYAGAPFTLSGIPASTNGAAVCLRWTASSAGAPSSVQLPVGPDGAITVPNVPMLIGTPDGPVDCTVALVGADGKPVQGADNQPVRVLPDRLDIYPPVSRCMITAIDPDFAPFGHDFTLSGVNLDVPRDQVVVTLNGQVAVVNETSSIWIKLHVAEPIHDTPKVNSLYLWGVAVPVNIKAPGPGDVASWSITIATAIAGLIAILCVVILISNLNELRHGHEVEVFWKEGASILYEPANNTYSLAKFQFYAWMITIVFVWLYQLLYEGWAFNHWTLPGPASITKGGLTTIDSAFITSLITLVVAQSILVVKGAHGSGAEGPHMSDLISYGGVIAPERVMQFAWTILGTTGYIALTIATYPTTRALPQLDEGLLLLTGMSATYAAGKLIRKAGPTIDQIVARDGTSIDIYGSNLSQRAGVSIRSSQGNQSAEIDIPPSDIQAPNSDGHPLDDTGNGFVSLLNVKIDAARVKLREGEVTVKLVNDDGQIAEVKKFYPAIWSVSQNADGTVCVKATHAGVATISVANHPAFEETAVHNQQPGGGTTANLYVFQPSPIWGQNQRVVLTTDQGLVATFQYVPPPVL
ncbi:MAG: hypothetical protein ACLQVD_14455 [Capsulimonadaceae bacterium]